MNEKFSDYSFQIIFIKIIMRYNCTRQAVLCIFTAVTRLSVCSPFHMSFISDGSDGV